MAVSVSLETDARLKRQMQEQLTIRLPEWFGQPESNRRYAAQAELLPGYDAAYNKTIPFADPDGPSHEEWTKILDINLTGPMLLTKAAAPALKRQGSGRIVNISSVAGLGPMGSSIA
jgi:NAD(P)-dependent dehydrogenase (short-subunit alcohol dehydrogenase family)